MLHLEESGFDLNEHHVSKWVHVKGHNQLRKCKGLFRFPTFTTHKSYYIPRSSQIP